MGVYANEKSDWSCAEIIVMNHKLSTKEMQCVEEYLIAKYNLFDIDSTLSQSVVIESKLPKPPQLPSIVLFLIAVFVIVTIVCVLLMGYVIVFVTKVMKRLDQSPSKAKLDIFYDEYNEQCVPMKHHISE